MGSYSFHLLSFCGCGLYFSQNTTSWSMRGVGLGKVHGNATSFSNDHIPTHNMGFFCTQLALAQHQSLLFVPWLRFSSFGVLESSWLLIVMDVHMVYVVGVQLYSTNNTVIWAGLVWFGPKFWNINLVRCWQFGLTTGSVQDSLICNLKKPIFVSKLAKKGC